MPSHIPASPAHLVDPDRVEAVTVLGPTIQFLTPPEGDAPCVMRGSIPPGMSVPLHRHADPETFMMLSGTLEALIVTGDDFEWIRVEPSAILHVPGNAKHGFRNPGREPAVTLITSTSRIARFFREVGKPAIHGQAPAPPTRAEIEHFMRTSEEYGYWNASPEENARVGITVPPLS